MKEIALLSKTGTRGPVDLCVGVSNGAERVRGHAAAAGAGA